MQTDQTTTLGGLRAWLAEAGAVPEGGRLPPERELAARFGVKRGEVRKALAVLEAEGRVRRHVGQGTFLIEHRAGEDNNDRPLSVAEIADVTSPLEAMQARRILEPEVARLAALNATSAQIAELRQAAARVFDARTWGEYLDLDGRFHTLIAEATGNKLLVEMLRLVEGVRSAVIWGQLEERRPVGPTADYHSFAEHDAIVEAVANRDRRGAADAMRRHLDSSIAALREEVT
jgi:DNA-binding FadR family transcriptional regulator